MPIRNYEAITYGFLIAQSIRNMLIQKMAQKLHHTVVAKKQTVIRDNMVASYGR
tara:strand:+ start:745 stop:906 length:162 start_codon:yes stop_codon:yes gene_type:complete